MTLADHVRTLGRGPGRSRSLTQAEARDAMTKMLSGQAAPEAIGALLMLLRMKGETPEEIAGFTKGVRQSLPDVGKADLDWPSYAAGRTRGLPWFLCAAQLVASAGHRVFLHGANGADQTVRRGVSDLSIPVAQTLDEARKALSGPGILYMPLEALSPQLHDLLGLRAKLGLRSCINTVCRMLDPGRSGVGVQGVFHPSYRLLQSEAAIRLGWSDLTVIKGGGGEFERLPGKAISAFGARNWSAWSSVFPAMNHSTLRLAEIGPSIPSIRDVWDGHIKDDDVEAVILGTAAIALETLGHAESLAFARELWATRHSRQAA